MTISPDGSKVVYGGRKDGLHNLYGRRINEQHFTPIPQTFKSWPEAVFSPESDRVAFFSQDGAVEMFSFEGGLPRKICDAGRVVYGADWGESNRLVFADIAGLHWVEMSEGSSPELLLSSDKKGWILSSKTAARKPEPGFRGRP